MKTSDFDYKFPQELIAHEPAPERDQSRLMVLDRQKRSLEHRCFYNIIDYLTAGDLLVLNNTKVIPANLVGIKEDGGAKVEILLVNSQRSATSKKQVWLCLVRPGKRLKVGSKVNFGEGRMTGTVLEKLETGEQIIEFKSNDDFWRVVHELGEMPLPPYINPKYETRNSKQILNSRSEISNRYQTVYAKNDGASAAPTAGLHFTPELLKKIKTKGIKVAELTLHTGLATFQPVRTDKIEEHKMHAEYFEIPKETVEAVRKAKRIIAVGTTVVRALETVGESLFSGAPRSFAGSSDLFIYPGFEFKIVNALITNFHWPRSTLIMLVSAFADKDIVDQAYQEAIREKYRFFSFGDAMLIL